VTPSRYEGRYLVGLIGSGIGMSLSPALHEREADELGLRYLYRRLDLAVLGLPLTEIDGLVAAIRLAGYNGFNVTHPCKQLVVEYLDGLSPEAAVLGAVNTVVFADGKAIGHNTDLSGFTRSVRTGLSGVPTDHVVLLGAGGAGAAVSHALLAMGAGTVRLFDTDPERAQTLAKSLCERFGADRAIAGRLNEGADDLADALHDADGLVHATPTGMAAYPGMPLPAELLRPALWVADIVYRPLDTELVTTARAQGCRVLDGGMMAVFQAADAFRLFTGREPDTDRMLRHFDSLVHATTPERNGTHAHR
jgi:shikimate dehydrogenase